MRRLAALLLAATIASPAAAQSNPAPAAAETAAKAERMAPFNWLVGEWRGSGWALGPDGKRHMFDAHEVVTLKLSGQALLVEGKHFEAGKPDRVDHDALAMLTWDNRANGYRFRTGLSSGMGGDFPVETTPDGFIWSIPTPGGTITYTVTHANGVWTERGRRKAADGSVVDFFEMTLKRQ